jgi:tRNA-binding protein
VPNDSLPASTAPISYDDFRKVDIRVGTIVAVDPFPEARRPSLKLTVDFGPDIGLRRSSAQVTVHYRAEELVGRQVAAVVNFPPKQIGRFMSEVLVLGFPDDRGEVVMIAPDKPVPNGGRLY